MNDDTELIGFIGLGDMGGAMATSLVRSGHHVLAYDLREDLVCALVEEGAEAAGSLTEIAERAEIISVVVVNDSQVRQVVGELLGRVVEGTTLIVHSTVEPDTIGDLSRLAEQHGCVLIDAAVSGGREKAMRGSLTVMVGGPTHIVERCRPQFEAYGSNVIHVGPVGAGVSAKIVNNLLTLGSYILQIEAMKLGTSYGIDEDAITDVVTVSQGDSRGVRTWGRMDRIRRERNPGRDPAMYERFVKDIHLAVAAAGAKGVDMPMAEVAAQEAAVQLAQRDELLAAAGWTPPPRCSDCGQELAHRYRKIAHHPECEERP